jgi:hypothetical protein
LNQFAYFPLPKKQRFSLQAGLVVSPPPDLFFYVEKGNYSGWVKRA